MTVSYWDMTLFSRLCHDPLNVNVPCCEYFLLSSNIHDESSYPRWLKCNSAMSRVQLMASDPRTGHMTPSYMTSLQATKMFTSITLDRIELKPCAMCHYVCFVRMHRRICNITSLGHASGQVIIWPKLRLNFTTDLSGPKCRWLLRLHAGNTTMLRIPSIFALVQVKHFQKRWYYYKETCFVLPAMERPKCDLR